MPSQEGERIIEDLYVLRDDPFRYDFKQHAAFAVHLGKINPRRIAISASHAGTSRATDSGRWLRAARAAFCPVGGLLAGPQTPAVPGAIGGLWTGYGHLSSFVLGNEG